MDHIDRRLLALLQDDARLGYQELGEAVGLSGPAAFQRVKKLEEAGVLTGYHAAIDPLHVGRPMTAFLRITPGRATDRRRVESTWRSMPEVQECHVVSGDGAYLLKVRARGVGDVMPLAEAARHADCAVTVDVVLETTLEGRRVPVS